MGDSQVVLFLSGDLMFASRVRAAAERSGLVFRLAGSLPEQPAGDESPPESVRFVVLDLATRGSLVAESVQWASQQSPVPQVIAYGPHVQAGRLRAAREAGIQRVMTRSQFDSRLGTLFAAE